METKFQTSFIPRRPLPSTPGALAPMVPKRHHESSSLFMMIAVFIFILALLTVGGAYFWKQYLLSDQTRSEQNLAQRRKEFLIDQISVIKAQSTKITYASQLLGNHLSMSKIFGVVSKLTSESVRFISMDISAPGGLSSPLQMTLVGYGRDFPSVAFQSDVLNQLEKYGLRAVVKNAIVSEPTLNHNGTVSFGFTAQVDPSSLAYTKSLGQQAAAADSAGEDTGADSGADASTTGTSTSNR